MTVRIRVSRPFFPSHTRLLSVLTRASTSGMLAFMDMALSSFSSWLFSSRYLFLKTRKTAKPVKLRQSYIKFSKIKPKSSVQVC